MHSFISSSRRTGVKIIIISLIILVMYAVAVVIIPRYPTGMTQWQTNILKAQKYAWGKQKYDYILLGSSEMNRIPAGQDELKGYNLAFTGGGAMTGLELVNEIQTAPTTLIIEANRTLIRGIDEDIVKASSGVTHRVFREQNRPDFLFYSLYRNLLDDILPQIESSETDPQLLDIAVEASQELINEDELDSVLGGLKSDIDNFQAQGYKIILIEIPNDVALYDTPQTNQVRSACNLYFPKEIYCWMEVDWSEYTTVDGEHLNKESSERLSNEIIQYLDGMQ